MRKVALVPQEGLELVEGGSEQEGQELDSGKVQAGCQRAALPL